MNHPRPTTPEPPRGLIDPAVVRALSTLRPARGLAQIALEWAAIALAILIAERVAHPLAYVLAVVFIGARQHALAILVHEGAHQRLMKGRLLNDVVCELLCAWPLLLTTTHRYRRNHTAHHLRLCTDRDPDWARKQGDDWAFPQPKRRLGWTLLRHTVGLGLVETLRTIRSFSDAPRSPSLAERRFGRARIAFMALAALAITLLGGWKLFLLYWLVPFLTWLQFVLRLRSIGEHFGIPPREGWLGLSRTTLTSWFDAVFLAPNGVGYHVEHHLYPSVPFYNLAALHRALMQNPEYAENLHLTRGYHRVLLECVR